MFQIPLLSVSKLQTVQARLEAWADTHAHLARQSLPGDETQHSNLRDNYGTLAASIQSVLHDMEEIS